jgi:Folylpolyglutamate synthase
VVVEHIGKGEQLFNLDLPGIYQKKNLLTVLASVDQLICRGFNIEEKHIVEGLAHVKKITGLHGRWEVLHKSPLIVLDVAHNADGIKQLVQQLGETLYDKLHIIFGLVKDKDSDAILSLLPADATYYFTKAQIPRALSEDELKKKAGRYQLKGEAYKTVNHALHAAISNASGDDLIVICGSIFVVGEVSLESLRKIRNKENFNLIAGDDLETANQTFFR